MVLHQLVGKFASFTVTKFNRILYSLYASQGSHSIISSNHANILYALEVISSSRGCRIEGSLSESPSNHTIFSCRQSVRILKDIWLNSILFSKFLFHEVFIPWRSFYEIFKFRRLTAMESSYDVDKVFLLRGQQSQRTIATTNDFHFHRTIQGKIKSRGRVSSNHLVDTMKHKLSLPAL